jgi:putative transposase
MPPPCSASQEPSWSNHDEWQVSDRRYLSEASMAELLTTQPAVDGPQLPPQQKPNQLDQ